MKKLILIWFLFTAGCATYSPMIDHSTSTAPPGRYQQDLSECQAYADRVSVGAGAIIGGVAGAALGAAVFAVFGANPVEGAAFGAGVGGLQGAVGSGMSQVDVIRRCMQGRGYTVLQ